VAVVIEAIVIEAVVIEAVVIEAVVIVGPVVIVNILVSPLFNLSKGMEESKSSRKESWFVRTALEVAHIHYDS
jgi:HD-like signal output (HDOD) protein